MKEQGHALQYDKAEIVFRACGGRKFRIIGIILMLIGILIIRALLDQSSEPIKNSLVYPIAGLWVISGVILFFYRSEVNCSRLNEVGNFFECLYDVKVKVEDGYHINIKRDIPVAQTAFYIANGLCEKLSLPLEDKATGIG